MIIITKSDSELTPSVFGKTLDIIKYTTNNASVPEAPPITPLSNLKKNREKVRGRFWSVVSMLSSEKCGP